MRVLPNKAITIIIFTACSAWFNVKCAHFGLPQLYFHWHAIARTENCSKKCPRSSLLINNKDKCYEYYFLFICHQLHVAAVKREINILLRNVCLVWAFKSQTGTSERSLTNNDHSFLHSCQAIYHHIWWSQVSHEEIKLKKPPAIIIFLEEKYTV